MTEAVLLPAANVKGSLWSAKSERILPLPEGLLQMAKAQAAAQLCFVCSLPLELLGPARHSVCSGEICLWSGSPKGCRVV